MSLPRARSSPSSDDPFLVYGSRYIGIWPRRCRNGREIDPTVWWVGPTSRIRGFTPSPSGDSDGYWSSEACATISRTAPVTPTTYPGPTAARHSGDVRSNPRDGTAAGEGLFLLGERESRSFDLRWSIHRDIASEMPPERFSIVVMIFPFSPLPRHQKRMVRHLQAP